MFIQMFSTNFIRCCNFITRNKMYADRNNSGNIVISNV